MNERLKTLQLYIQTTLSLSLSLSLSPPTKKADNMISLKATHTSFIPTKDVLLYGRGLSKKKNSFLSLCKSNDSESEASPPEGDTRKQELLAKIAMLQTQKVRLTDYLDERSAYLTQFAEEANAEFDQIGENALKGLDEASARIMENIESRMQAFEESTEMNKLALIGLLVVGIVDSLISSSSDWRKVAILGVILVALLSQFIYEQKMLSETKKREEEKK